MFPFLVSARTGCDTIVYTVRQRHYISCFYFQRLRGELATLERQLATLRKQLEEETLLRVDLENRIQSLKEELAFKSQVYEQVRSTLLRGMGTDCKVGMDGGLKL